MNTIPVQAFGPAEKSFYPALLHMDGNRFIGLERRSHGESSLYFAPGFIDSHAHVYPGATDLGIPVDKIGLSTGVHLVVDAGSAGSTNFPCFRDYVAPAFKTPIKAFLNIGRAGLVTKHPYFDPRDLDLSAAVDTMRQDHSGMLLGIKVLSSGLIVEEAGLEPLRGAVKAADALGCRIMAHLVEGPPSNHDTMALLRAGDIITHIFHGAPNLDANRKASKGATIDTRYCRATSCGTLTAPPRSHWLMPWPGVCFLMWVMELPASTKMWRAEPSEPELENFPSVPMPTSAMSIPWCSLCPTP